jgi:phosphoribosylamine--glycine ligase
MPICFSGELTREERDALHYGEVRLCDGQLETAGMIGYIAVVTGTGDTIENARKNAYRVVKKIVIPNSRYRDDIGEKLIREDFESLRKLGWIVE